jgi:hypothetical protein
MHKICQCFHNWGKESDDCEIGFIAKHPNEQYCDSCKPVSKKARIAYNVARFRQRQKQAGYAYDITDPDWTACWIDRVCSCCGIMGVPTFNRFLCIKCWETYADGDYSLHVSTEGAVTWAEYDERPSKVTTLCYLFTPQEDLQALIDECRAGSWKWNVRVSKRLRRLLLKMGLQEGNCPAY